MLQALLQKQEQRLRWACSSHKRPPVEGSDRQAELLLWLGGHSWQPSSKRQLARMTPLKMIARSPDSLEPWGTPASHSSEGRQIVQAGAPQLDLAPHALGGSPGSVAKPGTSKAALRISIGGPLRLPNQVQRPPGNAGTPVRCASRSERSLHAGALRTPLGRLANEGHACKLRQTPSAHTEASQETPLQTHLAIQDSLR